MIEPFWYLQTLTFPLTASIKLSKTLDISGKKSTLMWPTFVLPPISRKASDAYRSLLSYPTFAPSADFYTESVPLQRHTASLTLSLSAKCSRKANVALHFSMAYICGDESL